MKLEINYFLRKKKLGKKHMDAEQHASENGWVNEEIRGNETIHEDKQKWKHND